MNMENKKSKFSNLIQYYLIPSHPNQYSEILSNQNSLEQSNTLITLQLVFSIIRITIILLVFPISVTNMPKIVNTQTCFHIDNTLSIILYLLLMPLIFLFQWFLLFKAKTIKIQTYLQQKQQWKQYNSSQYFLQQENKISKNTKNNLQQSSISKQPSIQILNTNQDQNLNYNQVQSSTQTKTELNNKTQYQPVLEVYDEQQEIQASQVYYNQLYSRASDSNIKELQQFNQKQDNQDFSICDWISDIFHSFFIYLFVDFQGFLELLVLHCCYVLETDKRLTAEQCATFKKYYAISLFFYIFSNLIKYYSNLIILLYLVMFKNISQNMLGQFLIEQFQFMGIDIKTNQESLCINQEFNIFYSYFINHQDYISFKMIENQDRQQQDLFNYDFQQSRHQQLRFSLYWKLFFQNIPFLFIGIFSLDKVQSINQCQYSGFEYIFVLYICVNIVSSIWLVARLYLNSECMQKQKLRLGFLGQLQQQSNHLNKIVLDSSNPNYKLCIVNDHVLFMVQFLQQNTNIRYLEFGQNTYFQAELLSQQYGQNDGLQNVKPWINLLSFCQDNRIQVDLRQKQFTFWTTVYQLFQLQNNDTNYIGNSDSNSKKIDFIVQSGRIVGDQKGYDELISKYGTKSIPNIENVVLTEIVHKDGIELFINMIRKFTGLEKIYCWDSNGTYDTISKYCQAYNIELIKG